MSCARYFVLTGAPTPGDLLDRATAHGTAGRVVAHPAPGPGCYGAIELASAGIGSGGETGAGVGVRASSPDGAGEAPVLGEPEGAA